MLQMALSAFLLGLLSSLHCVGMCGPLLLALPVQRLNPAARTLTPLLYHAGRILTYSLGGLLFGLLGRRIYLAGWQQGFSIVLGVMILVLYFAGRFAINPVTRFSEPLRRLIGRLWRSPSTATFFMLGMANGLLPCGMVYLALAGALTRNTVAGATGFMALFGAGTLPLLLATQRLGRIATASFRLRLRRMLPLVTILMALLLILRGLNLGIPFLSPLLATAPGKAVSCH
ncbi:sulfite exporter TauE/SafE family protein [Puia dinghuensis]|uniref:Membrane protein n=1 Tax=Puia dinghuensis TaxID=1792502 RepID=A0A8J2XQN8_9BACT|nr:sulfite exporter TauE/SafE family protein [Puia dinghuensis]GGA94706.1 membrane protein [Puia dinghuensis]